MALLPSQVVVVFSMCAFLGAAVYAAESDINKSRVPADQLAAAKAKKNPHPATPENIAKGKEIYEGKGNCFICHGKSGKGDGPAGQILNPSPRNFANAKFDKVRTPGEMFWVIGNGSPGTGMVPLSPPQGTQITEEEAWLTILYERSFGEAHQGA
jgi:cytochrome c5